MDGGRLPKGRNVVTLVACVPFLFEKQLAGGTRATPTAFLCRPYCSGNHGIDFNLKSSVSFPKQRCLSHAETQRRGDSANMWRFAARFSLHPFGEESILSFRFPNFARTCKMLLFSGLSLRSLRPQRLCVRTQTRNLGSTYIPLLGFLAEPLRVQRTGGTTSSSLPVVSNPHVMRMGEKHRCSLL